MTTRFKLGLLTSSLLVAAGSFAAPAMAQDQSDQGGASEAQAIVVTGSRIARTDLNSTSPTAVVSAEEFQLSGATNVEQVLNTLPQVLPGVTSFSNNPGNGAATLNLRNLGAQRTLVLVNGRRWMFYDTNQIVDLNTIPQFLLEGVDVVTGGQSAVYGSDAIAGVVNFRLRQDIDGIILGGNYSFTSRGDGPRYDLNFAIGTPFADGRGQVTVYGNYLKREPIFQGARAYSRFAAGDGCVRAGTTDPQTGVGVSLGGALGTCVSRGGEIGLVPGGSPSTPIATLPGLGGGNGSIFNPTGGGIRPFQNPEDLYNFAPDNYLQLPQERYLIGGYGSYEITDGIEAYAEVSYVNSRVNQELAPTPGGINASLQINSPFFNPATQAALLAFQTNAAIPVSVNGAPPTAAAIAEAQARAAELALGRSTQNVGFRFNQAGPRNSQQGRSAFRILAGVRGEIVSNINYDLYYMYSRTENTQFQQGNVSVSRYRAALETETVGGVTRCRDAAARAAGCLPLNVFGLNLADPAAIRYVTINSTNLETSDLQNVVGSISGTLGSLFGNSEPVGFAIGGEYRRVSAAYTPDTFLASGDVIGFNAGQPTSGSYNAKEVFAELRVPLVNDSFIHRLELTGAARYSDYSLGNVGGVWTYAGGGEFAPIPDITFRGQYQRAVRAPNVQDLFGGQSVGFPQAIDPCSSRTPVALQTAAIRALCIANGVPAANVFTTAVQPAQQIQAAFGGNPNLGEETSDTFTVGAVIRPSFIPRLNITVDYFNIKVKDAISTFGGGLNSALQLCFTVAQDLNNPICSIFAGARNPATGALGETQAGRNPPVLSANIADLETSGIDVQVDYNIPLNFSLTGSDESRLTLFFLGTWLDQYRTTAVAAIPERVTIGEGTIALPEWRHTARLGYVDGPAQISLRWRYNGPGIDSRIINTFNGLVRVPQDPALFPNRRVGAFNYFDLTGSFAVTDNFQLTAGVNNMFNKRPPILGAAQEQGNNIPGFYDPLGRDFFVSARLNF
jgi:outer membrane receptor protein involved in Fe transport